MFVDWIACTVTEGAPMIREWITNGVTGPWTAQDFAPGRHTRTLLCGGIHLYTDAPNDESIHLKISGKGCRELEAAGIVEDLPEFLAKLLQAGGRFSRLDAAIDDRDGVLNMNKVNFCCDNGLVVCRYEMIVPSGGRDKISGAVTGSMVSFGRRGGESSIRIYDKGMKEGISEHWIRVELQTRDARAQSLAKAIAEGGQVVPGILLDCLAFKEKGQTDRRERWPNAVWWTQFLGTEKRFQLETAPRNASLEKSLNWMMNQVSSAFAEVYDSRLYPTFITDMLAQGRQKRYGKATQITKKPHARAERAG